VSDDHDRLFDAILAAGVAVEQVGLADGVSFEIDEDGSVSLVLGEEGAEQFDDIKDALQRIEVYAEELGGDGSRHGAIVDFVRALEKLAARAPAGRVSDHLIDCFDEVCAIADKLGLESLSHVLMDDTEVTADDVGDIGYFEDSNSVIWLVYVDDDEVLYRLVEL